MIKPPLLKTGDTIGICSPAGKINKNKIQNFTKHLLDKGFKVKISPHALGANFQYSGTDQERINDFQNLLNDPDIKAIFCARGGYGSIRIIDKIDFSNFNKSPKWIIGYSDITIFHNYISAIENSYSVHGIMPKSFDNSEFAHTSLEKTLDLLQTGSVFYEIAGTRYNVQGKAIGKLIGGNLSIIQNLRDSYIDLESKNSILFIEDIGEYKYSIDRMMQGLKLSGVLSNINGLVVGYFSNIKDDDNNPFGKSIEEIILDSVVEYKYPVLFNFPAGHELPNNPLIINSEIELNVQEKICSVKFMY